MTNQDFNTRKIPSGIEPKRLAAMDAVFVKGMHSFFLALSLLCFTLSLHSQSSAPGYKKLLNRYGSATPWANGYIVKVKSYYGFANKAGTLIISINNIRFDTLLPDRANVSYASWGSSLVDGNGTTVAHGDAVYYYLLNRRSRLFAARFKDNTEKFCNDKGEFLFGLVYDTRTPKDQMLGSSAFDGQKYMSGIINFKGDTLLPLLYQSTGYAYGHPPGLYCGIRNDTAYVFGPDRKFLFSKASVHSAVGINNAFIGLGKYGMYALVNTNGRLITGFRYTYIEPLPIVDSIIREADENHLQQLALAPDYFVTHRGSSKGLIDSSGKELLAPLYESIQMNSRKWLILRKTSHEQEELLNTRLEKVLETDAGGISFISKRYVRIETGRNTSRPTVKFYDMILDRFVDSPALKKNKLPQPKKELRSNYFYPRPDWSKDSVRINEAGTMLLQRKGRWGVCSLTGEIILPFMYDTAFQNGALYVGLKGKIAPLNWEGELAYPVGLSEFPQYWSVVDSQLVIKSNVIYSFKGWKLQKVEPAENRTRDPFLQFVAGIAYAYGNSPAKRGLYNRKMKKLGQPVRHQSSPMVRSTGIVALEDSVKGLVAVIDSTGRYLVPWMKEPNYFMLRDHYALALGDTGKPDILFRFEKGSTLSDTVWLNASDKFYLLNDRERYYGPDDSRPLHFEKRGCCKGILNTKPVMLIKGAEKIDVAFEAIRVKVGGKWGMYDYDQKQMLPHQYDSIEPMTHYFRLVVKNGKTGFFDIHQKRLIEPAYDSVCYQNSYVMRYFIGHRNGQAEVVNTDGRIISSGWQSISPLCHYAMEDLLVTKNGITYILYPTLGDSLEALPYKGLATDLTILEHYADGLNLVTKDGKTGLYSNSESSLKIPAEYESIERVNDYFFAKNTQPESLTLYSPEGVRMFSLSGTYYDPILVHNYQWQLWGPKGYLVFNSTGKIIVPTGYKTIKVLNAPGPPLYLLEAENGKCGLMDTSGKSVTQNLFDDIDEESMYNGYRSVTLKSKTGLLSPEGKLLTPCMYESVTAGKSSWLIDSDQACDTAQTRKPGTAFFIIALSVKENLKYGLLDKNGKLLIPCIYNNILQVEEGRTVIVSKKGYYGLVTVTGKPLTTVKYDYIQNFQCGKARFRRGELEGVLSPDGNETLNK